MKNKSIEKLNPFLSFLTVFENGKSEINTPDINMYEMVKISAEANPNAIALEYFGKTFTYKKLIERIKAAASSYAALGVKSGDIVTIIMANTPEAIISIYALNSLGAICNILHPLSSVKEIMQSLVSVKSRVLLTMDFCYERIKPVISETHLKNAVVVSAGDSMGFLMKSAFSLKQHNSVLEKDDDIAVSWSSFIKSGKKINFETAKNKEAVILHSGGTTGTPKEIVLSNSNFNSFSIQSVATLRDIKVGDKVLAILPIFHGFGLGVCIHVTLCFGACAVLVPKFNAKNFGNLIKKYKPTMVYGVPTLYEAMLSAKGLEKLNFSFLKYAISGGDFLPPVLEERVNDFFKNHESSIKISEGYGLTESLAAVCLSVNENYKKGSIGKPLVGNEFCIVDPETDCSVQPGEVGEICINGPTVMLGYRNNEIETANALKIHSDGKTWLHTGDMGMVDDEGFVFYKSRRKRLIISSGYNIYPRNVENVIEQLCYVEKCVVVGIPHPYKKEVAKAYIVLKNGVEPCESIKQRIKHHCADSLAYFSIPYEYEFVKSLPTTPLGKIDFVKLANCNSSAE